MSDLLYCNIHFTGVVWNQTHNISELWIQIFIKHASLLPFLYLLSTNVTETHMAPKRDNEYFPPSMAVISVGNWQGLSNDFTHTLIVVELEHVDCPIGMCHLRIHPRPAGTGKPNVVSLPNVPCKSHRLCPHRLHL